MARFSTFISQWRHKSLQNDFPVFKMKGWTMFNTCASLITKNVHDHSYSAYEVVSIISGTGACPLVKK
jgi:hypothetical protein